MIQLSTIAPHLINELSGLRPLAFEQSLALDAGSLLQRAVVIFWVVRIVRGFALVEHRAFSENQPDVDPIERAIGVGGQQDLPPRRGSAS